MALHPQNILFFILAITFLVSFHTTTATFDAPKTGLSFNLTFIDPNKLHQNLTHAQTKQRISSRLNPSMIRPPLLGGEQGYYAVVRPGNPPNLNTLLLDTTGSLTWIQCAPCDPCFVQDDRMFDTSLSSTYQPMKCSDPFCHPPYRCINNECRFHIAYGGGSDVYGNLARETFHFTSSTGHPELIKELAFGCVRTSRNYNGHYIASGVFSLDYSSLSFTGQLALSRFSYCFHYPGTPAGNSYLRFGTDIIMHAPLQITPLLHYHDSSMHYLDLVDITIHTTRLRFPPNLFSRQANGRGGCIIDTTSPTSAFIQPAWNQIQHFFIEFYRQYNIHPVPGPATLCFPLVDRIDRSFVSITLHFQNGALLHLTPDKLWRTIPQQGIFCSTLTYHPHMTVIGFTQQIDIWLMYDLQRNELSYATRVDCSRE